MTTAGILTSKTFERTLFQRVVYDSLWVIVRVSFVPLFQIRIYGRENLPAEGGALLCANHQSHLDPVLVAMACDRRLSYLARQSLFKFGPFRWLIETLDAIPINRDGSGLGGLKETLRRLRHGQLVAIHPEGTRTMNGRIAPLKPGFIAVARRSHVPLVPIGFDGAFDALPRSSLVIRPTRIHIHIGPSLAPDEVARMSDAELLAELDRRIRLCYEAARGGRRR